MQMEYAMRFATRFATRFRPELYVASTVTAVGLALALGASAAQAQAVETVVAPTPLVPAATTTVMQPATAIQTTETVRTVRPAPLHSARRQIVTTRTITRQVVPAPMIARTVPAAPQPLYDEVAPAPIVTSSDTDYGPPLYDEVVAPGAPAPMTTTQPFIYRYVYQPDRILVIDPNTGVAVQSIPR